MIFYDFNVDPHSIHSPTANTKFVYNYDLQTTQEPQNYTRVTIPFSQANLRILNTLHKYNVICILIDEYSQIKNAIDMQPDLIAFNPSIKLKLRPGYIRDAINRGVFFEVTFEAMDSEWLRCCDDLLRITNGRGIVTGSGKGNKKLLKGRGDVEHFLGAFLSEKSKTRVLANGGRLMEACAMRRYSFRGVVSNSQPCGILKQDFIVNRFKEL